MAQANMPKEQHRMHPREEGKQARNAFMKSFFEMSSKIKFQPFSGPVKLMSKVWRVFKYFMNASSLFKIVDM